MLRRSKAILASSVAASALSLAGAAQAQTVPGSNTQPIALGSTAPDQPPQLVTGQPGVSAQSGDDFIVELEAGQSVKSADVAALVDISSNGGRGGDGGISDADLDSNGPLAGNGGNGGAITVKLDIPALDGSYSLLENYAANGFGVRLNSRGGKAGDGQQNEGTGNGGIGGIGGTGGKLTFTLLQNPELPESLNFIEGQGAAIYLTSIGGDGGASGESSGGYSQEVTGRKGGAGGDGGDIDMAVAGNINGYDGGSGIVALSIGGGGGTGGAASDYTAAATGADGGDAGDGGNISVSIVGGTVTAQGPAQAASGPVQNFDSLSDPSVTVPLDTSFMVGAIVAISTGGTGGLAGLVDGAITEGGNGAAGGSGGTVVVNLGGSSLPALNQNAVISTSGYGAFGVLALSEGGDGGNGDSGGGALFRSGGAGGTGGNGGAAFINVGNDTTTPYARLISTGDDSDMLVAISVGGGGGYSGDVSDASGGGGAGFALYIGGVGGKGGDAGSAFANNGYFDPPPTNGSDPAFHQGNVILTSGTMSRGIVAQSVGGGGGRGGDATSTSLSSTVSIGGKGGSGGVGDLAQAINFGIISTSGSHAAGVFVQSVGGGGGSGGGALSRAIGAQVSVAIAVGGEGGSGGVAGDAVAYNPGQVQTLGANAHAIFAQSVGGGGGLGGTAAAEAYSTNLPDEPSLTISTAVGGKGGTGGHAGKILVVNSGLLQTQGLDAYGVFAQSVGGGGGIGGDATATSLAYQQAKLTISTAIGGSGGAGGDGGAVTVRNSGFINTSAATAIGVFAQSVGGGGGTGGVSNVNQGAIYSAGSYSSELSLAIGGQGGVGGVGGDVTIFNSISGAVADPDYFADTVNLSKLDLAGNGGILTSGDMAAAIFAQSVGGGGGHGSDATGKGGNGQISLNVAIGGNGGSGNHGGTVSVHNGSGAIQTNGAQSYGILAQSVGGGGGTGGNAVTGSGEDPEYGFPEQAFNLSTGNIAQNPTQFTKVSDYVWDWKDNVKGMWDDKNRLQELSELNKSISTAEPPTFFGLTASDLTIDVGGGAGGKGGAGGDGGTVSVDSSGSILTYGAMSHAIIAQSVGGGGGVGGGSAPATANDQLHDSVIESAISLGGKAGSGGDGGAVTVVNDAGGDIETNGDIAIGLLAQSVGGGGGIAGASMPNAGLGNPMALTLGGAGDDSYIAIGKGGAVVATNSALIATTGDHGIGMMAQSVGGGGGIVAVTGQTQNEAHNLFDSTTQSLAQGNVTPVLAENWLGTNNSGGNVTANLNSGGSIVTSGINAFGILAQSVAGGGGLIVVDPNNQVSVNDLATDPTSSAPVGGNNAGLVSVVTQGGTSIRTTGDGAVGIVAQSLGGAGALVNGFVGIDLTKVSQTVYQDRWDMGMGGAVTIVSNSNITTSGQYAHGIFAQIASGTGGVIGRSDGTGTLFRGGTGEKMLCGGTDATQGGDCGGVATAMLQAGTITVSGAHSWGVVLETEYVSHQFIDQMTTKDWSIAQMTVANGARVFAQGNAAGAVFLNGSGANGVNNSGVIDASQSAGGYAISTTGWSFLVTNNASGVIRGSFGKNCAGACSIREDSVSAIENNGSIEAGKVVDLGGGVLTNAGALHIGTVGTVATTTLTGHLVQQASGTLHIDADLAGNKADSLAISGTANIAGTVHVAPTSISNRSMKVLTASGGLTLDPSLAMSDSSHLYDFRSTVSGNDLSVSAVANFKVKATGFGANERSVAGSLQSLFDGGASADNAFTRLLSVADDVGYEAGLKSLAGQGLGAFGAFRFNSSRTFAANLYGGCVGLQLEDRAVDRCGWARVLGNSTTQDAGTDKLGYKADAWGLQMGGQTPLSDELALTGSLAYESSKFRDGSARITGDTLVAGLGLLYTPARLELSAGIDAAYGWYKSRRTITLGLSEQANASPKQSQLGGHVRLAYNLLDEGRSFVRPFAEGHAIHVSNKGFTETGASPFRLAVEGRSDTAVIGVAGVELGTKVALSEKVSLRPFASAAIEYGSPRDWTTTARFAEQPQGDSFDLHTAGPGTLGKFAIGADLLGARNVTLSIQYAPELGKDFTSHSGTARLTIAF